MIKSKREGFPSERWRVSGFIRQNRDRWRAERQGLRRPGRQLQLEWFECKARHPDDRPKNPHHGGTGSHKDLNVKTAKVKGGIVMGRKRRKDCREITLCLIGRICLLSRRPFIIRRGKGWKENRSLQYQRNCWGLSMAGCPFLERRLRPLSLIIEPSSIRKIQKRFSAQVLLLFLTYILAKDKERGKWRKMLS